MNDRPMFQERELIYAYKDDVERMRAEIERLRTALQQIASDEMMTRTVSGNQRTMWLIASDALGQP